MKKEQKEVKHTNLDKNNIKGSFRLQNLFYIF